MLLNISLFVVLLVLNYSVFFSCFRKIPGNQGLCCFLIVLQYNVIVHCRCCVSILPLVPNLLLTECEGRTGEY